ncbi:hypothetical protein BUALT_Bualt15G0063000 [Buddleja alternifolia]|uniref:Ubiquitin-like protease family profile domain-containing protein n=1 Tax=Buddleja alternifolia TaxID=168488 RepID=A0AAV6WJM2_9LAMI|nr:hypothetical protein BUALT_Bualt15G0063000 [Buddleja alternifolia]
MGKRRNEKGKSYGGGGGEGNTASNYSYGGDSKFSVFDFDDDELRIETDSRKSLAKFGARSPNKRSAYCQPVDKYVFLECFAQGNHIQQNGNDLSGVDFTDTVSKDRTFSTDAIVSHGPLNCESKTSSFLKHHDFEYSSCGAKSCAQGRRKPGGCTTDKKHHKVLYVDSDEDVTMELRSSTFLDLAENEGSSEKSSEHGANTDNCETVVVIDPNYVKYDTMYYTKCVLTFSQRFIRLKVLPLSERKKPYFLEWSTSDILKIDYQQYESVKADVVKFHIKPEDKDVVENRKGNSGAVELEFVVVDDPQWSKKQEEIKSLDLKYKDAWNTMVSECSFNEPFEEIIYPEGDPDAVFISRSDIELLQPRTFINDTIIDFYIKYLVNKTKQEEQHRFHFFNTFFFRKLANMDQESSRALEGREAFERVRKWTRNLALEFDCYVPSWGNKDMDDSFKFPCILHMDSIRGSHRGLENLIRSYLWEEWKERHNKLEADTSTKFVNLDFVALQLPQQENLFDCGLFLLHYAELFLEQASNINSAKCFDFLNKDWFLPAEVSLKKRDHIRKLIHRIVEDNDALKDPPPTCTNSVQENNAKESCLGIKFDYDDNYEIKGQQNFIDMLDPRNIDKSATDETAQPFKQLVPINQFSNMKLPMEEEALKSKPVIIYVHDEDCVREVASSSEDLAACVVEDSEEEIGTECIRKTRRPSSLVSPPMGSIMVGNSANNCQNGKENRRQQ